MKPGDFALGSELSRAAARLVMEQRQRGRERLELILGCSPSEDRKPHATAWTENAGGTQTFRIISIPAGFTLSEGLRAVSGYSAKELEDIAQRYPEPLEHCELWELRRS